MLDLEERWRPSVGDWVRFIKFDKVCRVIVGPFTDGASECEGLDGTRYLLDLHRIEPWRPRSGEPVRSKHDGSMWTFDGLSKDPEFAHDFPAVCQRGILRTSFRWSELEPIPESASGGESG